MTASPSVPGLAGKIAIVTGGSAGIGFATAGTLCASGASVLLAARRQERLVAAAEALAADYGDGAVAWCQADVAAPAAADAIVTSAIGRFGHADLLCNNAGIDGSGRLLDEIEDDHWRRVLDANVTGAFRLSQAFVRHLRARGAPGAIVNVASINGLMAERAFADYNTSKGALVALTRSAAVDVGDAGIRVNAVCPGYVETEMTAGYLAESATRARLEDAIPLDRVGTAAEVAAVIAFLLSDLATYVTGSIVTVDGGRSAGWIGALDEAEPGGGG